MGFENMSAKLLDDYERMLMQRKAFHSNTSNNNNSLQTRRTVFTTSSNQQQQHTSPRVMEMGAKAVIDTVFAVEHAFVDAVRDEVHVLFQQEDSHHPIATNVDSQSHHRRRRGRYPQQETGNKEEVKQEQHTIQFISSTHRLPSLWGSSPNVDYHSQVSSSSSSSRGRRRKSQTSSSSSMVIRPGRDDSREQQYPYAYGLP